jgi:hypothetical protein
MVGMGRIDQRSFRPMPLLHGLKRPVAGAIPVHSSQPVQNELNKAFCPIRSTWKNRNSMLPCGLHTHLLAHNGDRIA